MPQNVTTIEELFRNDNYDTYAKFSSPQSIINTNLKQSPSPHNIIESRHLSPQQYLPQQPPQQYLPQQPRQQPRQQHSPSYMNCRDIATHIKECPVCCQLYKQDKTIYILLICMLFIVCVILVIQLIKKK